MEGWNCLHTPQGCLRRPRQPTHELTFPAGGGALRCAELLPVVISASPWGLWCWRHRAVRPVGRKSIRMPHREGLRRFRGEYFRGPSVQVFLPLRPLLPFSPLLRAPPLCQPRALEGLPWERQVHTQVSAFCTVSHNEETALTLKIR